MAQILSLATRTWRQHWLLIATLTLATILGLIGLMAPGPGEDGDVFMALQHAQRWPQQGYTPIRTWGFPLYELYTYPLIVHFGDVIARVPGVVFYLATIGLIYGCCRGALGNNRAALIALGVATVPAIQLSASELMETSLSLFTGLAFVLTVLRWRAVTHLPDGRGVMMLTLLAVLATGVRADNVMLFGAFGLAVILHTRRLPPRLILAGILFAVLVASIWIIFYGRHLANIINFGLGVIQPDPWSRRIIRAALGAVAAVGLPFVGFLLVALWRRRLSHLHAIARGETLFLLLMGGVWAVRFAVLPDEVTYLVIPVATFIIILGDALCKEPTGQRWLVAMVIALALPNLVQVALFERPHLTLEPRLSLQPGAIYQDLRYRDFYQAQWTFNYDLIKHPDLVGCNKVFTAIPARQPPPDSCVVMNRALLRYLDPRRGDVVRRQRAALKELKHIFFFDGVTGRGWRHFLPFEAPAKPTVQNLIPVSSEQVLTYLDGPAAKPAVTTPPSP